MIKYKNASRIVPLLIVVLNCLPAQATQEFKHQELKVFPKSYGPHKPHGAEMCKSDDINPIALSQFQGLSKHLKAGVACIVADFDGNGTPDYALIEHGWNEDITEVGKSRVIVLFYGPKGFIKTVPLKEEVQVFSFEIYPKTTKKGHFGEPVTVNPGLIEQGEGNATTVYLYDSKLSNFVKSTYASEAE